MLIREFNGAVLKGLGDGLSLIEITRDAPDALVAQLVGRDRVHPQHTDSLNDLRLYRLGGPSFNRRCFALASCEDDPKVYAMIFAHLQTRPISSTAKIPGKLGSILSNPTCELGDKPISCIQFYSISSFEEIAPKGAGKILIGAVHAHLKEDSQTATAYKTTLSPLRSYPFPEKDGLRGQNTRIKRWNAIIHLLQGIDNVQRFHMGNGATIGLVVSKADINCHNNPMVEYHYSDDPEVLKSNAKVFREAVLAYDKYKEKPSSSEFIAARDRMNAVVYHAMAPHLQKRLPTSLTFVN